MAGDAVAVEHVLKIGRTRRRGCCCVYRLGFCRSLRRSYSGVHSERNKSQCGRKKNLFHYLVSPSAAVEVAGSVTAASVLGGAGGNPMSFRNSAATSAGEAAPPRPPRPGPPPPPTAGGAPRGPAPRAPAAGAPAGFLPSAMSSAVKPSLLVISSLAPAFARARIISRLPACAAIWRTDDPSGALALGFAPPLSSVTNASS